MGDLVFDKVIDYAFGLYGQSKAGKTTASQLLAGAVLIGRKIKGFDMVECQTTRYKDARIGNNSNS
jgi:hypothetical protein